MANIQIPDFPLTTEIAWRGFISAWVGKVMWQGLVILEITLEADHMLEAEIEFAEKVADKFRKVFDNV